MHRLRAILAVTCAFLAAGPAAARTDHPGKGRGPDLKAALAPLERVAGDCFADAIMSNPKAVSLARSGHWYEAAGLTGYLCRRPVGDIMQAHDMLRGRGTGMRYVRKAFVPRLDRELALRLEPVFASAGPSGPQAGPRLPSMASAPAPAMPVPGEAPAPRRTEANADPEAN